ncbi:hypothetical protein PVAND_016025 [Polypedilum vanderplanki]|uniref:Uncharacterized protein n=2 Tax=Polypedilum vanderplanki TaxID=319348 RepID=A0A9J6BEY2_POLVA|nr:hypothetical protein PVAND_016025 [Polypedilum vanderplanki]
MKNFLDFSIKFAVLCYFYFVFVDLAKIRNKKQEKAQNDTWVCRNLTYIKTHPLDCCKYPRFIDNKDDFVEECAGRCRSIPYPEFWCHRFCIIEKNGFFTYEQEEEVQPANQGERPIRMNFRKINAYNLIASFVNHTVKRIYNTAEYLNGPKMGTVWGNVTKKSIDDCKYLFPVYMPNGKSKIENEAQFEYFYNLVVDCVRKENFLNCPAQFWNNKLEDCKKLKYGMSLCSTKHLDFVHMLLFEDFYDQNHTEATAEKVRGYNYTMNPNATTTTEATTMKISELTTFSAQNFTQSQSLNLTTTKITNIQNSTLATTNKITKAATALNSKSEAFPSTNEVNNSFNHSQKSSFTSSITVQTTKATNIQNSTSPMTTQATNNSNSATSIAVNQISTAKISSTSNLEVTTKNLQNFTQQTSNDQNESLKITTENILSTTNKIVESSTARNIENQQTNSVVAQTTSVNHETKNPNVEISNKAQTMTTAAFLSSTKIHHETTENSMKSTDAAKEMTTKENKQQEKL